jgi:hypothetical protein
LGALYGSASVGQILLSTNLFLSMTRIRWWLVKEADAVDDNKQKEKG